MGEEGKAQKRRGLGNRAGFGARFTRHGSAIYLICQFNYEY